MINKDLYYMNVNTGSVQNGSDWLDDLEPDEDTSFLVEVINVDGEWVEA